MNSNNSTPFPNQTMTSRQTNVLASTAKPLVTTTNLNSTAANVIPTTAITNPSKTTANANEAMTTNSILNPNALTPSANAYNATTMNTFPTTPIANPTINPNFATTVANPLLTTTTSLNPTNPSITTTTNINPMTSPSTNCNFGISYANPMFFATSFSNPSTSNERNIQNYPFAVPCCQYPLTNYSTAFVPIFYCPIPNIQNQNNQFSTLNNQNIENFPSIQFPTSNYPLAFGTSNSLIPFSNSVSTANVNADSHSEASSIPTRNILYFPNPSNSSFYSHDTIISCAQSNKQLEIEKKLKFQKIENNKLLRIKKGSLSDPLTNHTQKYQEILQKIHGCTTKGCSGCSFTLEETKKVVENFNLNINKKMKNCKISEHIKMNCKHCGMYSYVEHEKKERIIYFLLNKQVCRDCFCSLLAINPNKLTKIVKYPMDLYGNFITEEYLDKLFTVHKLKTQILIDFFKNTILNEVEHDPSYKRSLFLPSKYKKRFKSNDGFTIQRKIPSISMILNNTTPIPNRTMASRQTNVLTSTAKPLVTTTNLNSATANLIPTTTIANPLRQQLQILIQ